MLSKFWKQTIMTSPIDFYCLACESYLRGEEDMLLHVDKPIHKKKLDATVYFEKYKSDRIREVPAGYYCEFCNILYTNTAKVDLHVSDTSHATNIGNQLLKRSGNSILAYNNVAIDENAWHGFIETTCVICDDKFEDQNIHKTKTKHILNLVQSKLLAVGRSIYRQTGEGFIQCLTCNILLSVNCTSHFDSEEHKNKYDSCVTETEENEESKDKPKLEVPNVVGKKENKIDSNKKVKKNKKNESNGPLVNLEMKTDDYDDEYYCKALDAKNYITMRDDGKWCILCEWYIRTISEEEHLQSKHHITILNMHKKRLEKLKENKIKSSTEYNSRGEKSNVKDDSDKIVDAVSEFAKGGMKINFEMRTASCKKCSKNIEYDFDCIKNHIEGHKSTFDLKGKLNEAKNTKLYSKPVVKSKEEDEAASGIDFSENIEIITFAAKHDLTHKGNKYYCRVCEASVSASMKSLIDHVYGSGHKNRLSRLAKSPKISKFTIKVPMKDFIKTADFVQNVLFKDVIVNEKFCMNILSFYMFTMYTEDTKRLRCHPCEESFHFNDADFHKNRPPHEEKMKEVNIMVSFEDEFLREVRDGLIHCGYCNLVMNTDATESHLASLSHNEAKQSSKSRLETYLPKIAAQQQQRAMEVMLFRMLMQDRAAKIAYIYYNWNLLNNYKDKEEEEDEPTMQTAAIESSHSE